MRRSPFYASYPSRYYNPFEHGPAQADASYLRPHPQHSSASSAPRSVINIPVQGSSISPSPHLLDPDQAATRIQSCFRGFSVRRHRPIFHLRSISTIGKELQGLKCELQSPGFASKIRENDKERLRFSETVMALILRLDAIEGSLTEVRSQRKEVTKMAIRLQDDVDAMMMRHDEALDSTKDEAAADGVKLNQEEAVLQCEYPSQQAPPTSTEEPTVVYNGGISMVHNTVKDQCGSSMENSCVNEQDVGDLAEKSLDVLFTPKSLDVVVNAVTAVDEAHEDLPRALSGDKVVEEPNHNTNLLETRDVSDHIVCSVFEENALPNCPKRKREEENPGDATSDVCSQTMAAIASGAEMNSAAVEMEGINATKSAVECEVMDGFEPLHTQAEDRVGSVDTSSISELCLDVASSPKSTNGGLPLKDTGIDDTRGTPRSPPEALGTVPIGQPLEALGTMPIGDELSEDVKESPALAVNPRKVNMSSPMLEDDASCSLDPPSQPICCSMALGLASKGRLAESSPLQERSCDYQGTGNCEGIIIKGKPQPSKFTEVEASIPDTVRLQQLSEDCKLMKTLLSKLLLQTKAQSKVICALGDRLEALEQRQQPCNHQHVKRKGKKRSKSKGAN